MTGGVSFSLPFPPELLIFILFNTPECIMRRTEDEVTCREEILGILKKATICRLALHDAEYPYIVPLNFGMEVKEDLYLYFHCAREGRKLDLIRRNNKASFEVEADTEMVSGDKFCGWTMKFRSVIGNGTMEIRDDEEGIRHGLDVLMQHYTGRGEFSYDEKVLKKTLILRLTVHQLSAKRHGYGKE